MLKSGYAILETEAIVACHAMGLDPALGLVRTGTRYGGSLERLISWSPRGR
jgi:hypothetical protein